MLLGEDEWAAAVEGRLTVMMMVDVEGLNWLPELAERGRERALVSGFRERSDRTTKKKKMKRTGDTGALLKKIA